MSFEPKVGKNLALFCFAHFSQRPSISSKNGFYQKRSILGLRPEALPVIRYFCSFRKLSAFFAKRHFDFLLSSSLAVFFARFFFSGLLFLVKELNHCLFTKRKTGSLSKASFEDEFTFRRSPSFWCKHQRKWSNRCWASSRCRSP